MQDKIIVCICDGAVIGVADGPSGWAAMVDGKLYYGNDGGIIGNNAAELYAIYQGLIRVPAYSRVLVWTDSKWCIQWIHGRPLRNPLIKNILAGIMDVICHHHLIVVWQHVKGHSSNVDHNAVDHWANKMAREA